VLILSDMGSLNTFGEIISKKTGIKTATIKMVTTPMVIEATRKSLLPNVTLDLLAKDIKEESGYIGNSVSDLPDEQRASTELIDTVRKEKIIFILNESLTFLNAGQVYELLEQSAKNIAVKIPLEDYDAFWLKFLFHVSAMLERAIRDEQFPRRHVKAIIENDPKLYQYLRALLIPIENRYAIKIADGEISYLMELIQLNEQPKSSTQTAH
jgi:transcriptional regulatory protein LevR